MSYDPLHPGHEITIEWLYAELLRVSSGTAAPTTLQFEVLHIEPERPQNGMLAYADGTDWNPGAGAGLYERRGGAWAKL